MFKKLTQAVIGTAILPIDIVLDVVTLDIVENRRTRSGKRLEQISINVNKALEEE